MCLSVFLFFLFFSFLFFPHFSVFVLSSSSRDSPKLSRFSGRAEEKLLHLATFSEATREHRRVLSVLIVFVGVQESSVPVAAACECKTMLRFSRFSPKVYFTLLFFHLIKFESFICSAGFGGRLSARPSPLSTLLMKSWRQFTGVQAGGLGVRGNGMTRLTWLGFKLTENSQFSRVISSKFSSDVSFGNWILGVMKISPARGRGEKIWGIVTCEAIMLPCCYRVREGN